MSMIAFYNGASGMRAFQSKLDVVSHNIANVQTNGYKPRRAAFDELLYTRINTNVEGNHLVGHGVKQEFVDSIMGQAGLDNTMQALDFAIVGDGFFEVEYRGERQYTRNGAFALSMEGNVPTLVTNDGAYVLDRAGNRITIPVGADGTFSTEGLRERLGLFTFPNQWGLIPQDNARFVISDNSGEPVAAQLNAPAANQNPVDIIQGALEFSGVDLGNEMINVIFAQRAFQMNSRVLQTADQIAEELNRLR